MPSGACRSATSDAPTSTSPSPASRPASSHSTRSNGSVRRSKSGTSMAAPAVAGALALILAEAASRSLKLMAHESRSLLIQSARRPAGEAGWNRRWSAGRLEVAAGMALLTATPFVAKAGNPDDPSPACGSVADLPDHDAGSERKTV
ncbi:S8 family serine peptidase [Methylobacterium sp. OAE515]|uniref:S8 family serine peptidase n=1 Tax=Methylobacterium sp. OAE515 TaxID=2817895 RepID=UPI00359FC240